LSLALPFSLNLRNQEAVPRQGKRDCRGVRGRARNELFGKKEKGSIPGRNSCIERCIKTCAYVD